MNGRLLTGWAVGLNGITRQCREHLLRRRAALGGAGPGSVGGAEEEASGPRGVLAINHDTDYGSEDAHKTVSDVCDTILR